MINGTKVNFLNDVISVVTRFHHFTANYFKALHLENTDDFKEFSLIFSKSAATQTPCSASRLIDRLCALKMTVSFRILKRRAVSC